MKVLTTLFCDDTVVSRAEARSEILTAMAKKLTTRLLNMIVGVLTTCHTQ
jgi:hypothetical protein